jgi:hypothetical protein
MCAPVIAIHHVDREGVTIARRKAEARAAAAAAADDDNDDVLTDTVAASRTDNSNGNTMSVSAAADDDGLFDAVTLRRADNGTSDAESKSPRTAATATAATSAPVSTERSGLRARLSKSEAVPATLSGSVGSDDGVVVTLSVYPDPTHKSRTGRNRGKNVNEGPTD